MAMNTVNHQKDDITNKVSVQKSKGGAAYAHIASSDTAPVRISRAYTVLNSSDVSTAGTPALWIPMDNWDEISVFASTASTTGSLVIEYSMDGGATTEAITTTKALASGDAVIQFSDLEASATANDPALTTLAKIAAYFRPSISGGSANAGTIKVFMRGWE